MGEQCGVYKYVCNDEIIYIGKSDCNIKGRLECHRDEPKFKPYLKSGCTIYYAWLPNPAYTVILETYLINKYKPCLNKTLKYDDNLLFDIPEPCWHKMTSYNIALEKDYKPDILNNESVHLQKHYESQLQKLRIENQILKSDNLKFKSDTEELITKCSNLDLQYNILYEHLHDKIKEKDAQIALLYELLKQKDKRLEELKSVK